MDRDDIHQAEGLSAILALGALLVGVLLAASYFVVVATDLDAFGGTSHNVVADMVGLGGCTLLAAGLMGLCCARLAARSREAARRDEPEPHRPRHAQPDRAGQG